MNRKEWLKKISDLVINTLPEQGQKIIMQFDIIQEYKGLSSATLLSFILYEFFHCKTSYEISNQIYLANIFDVSVTKMELLNKIIEPIIKIYIQNKNGFISKWGADLIFNSFFHYYLSFLVKDKDALFVKNELHSLWGFQDEKLINQLLTLHSEIKNNSIEQLLSSKASDNIDKTINEFISDKNTDAEFQGLLNPFSSELKNREDLINILKFKHILPLLKQDLLENKLEKNEEKYFLKKLQNKQRKLEDAIKSLSHIEIEMLLPQSEEDKIINNFVAARNGLTFINDLIYPYFPEKINGKSFIPNTVEDYVFAYNGRLRHKSIGPIPSLIVVSETKLDAPLSIGITDVTLRENELSLNIIIQEATNEKLLVPFSFGLDFATHIYDLLHIVQKKHARLDILELKEKLGLEVVKSFLVPFPEFLIKELKKILSPILLDKFYNNAELFRDALITGYIKRDIDAEFLSCESTKAEIFLNEFSDCKNPEYLNTKHNILKKREEKAKLLIKNDTIKIPLINKEIELESSNLIKISDTLRSEAKFNRNEINEHSLEIAQALETDGRCLVHINYAEGYFDAVWIKPVGKSYMYGHIDISHLKPDTLSGLFNRYICSKAPKKLYLLNKILEHIGEYFAKPLVDALRPLEVNNLIISPTLFLEALPLHCAPVGIKDKKVIRLLDVFETVTYLPSAKLLLHLKKLGPVPINKLLVGYSSGFNGELKNTIREGKYLLDLFPNLETNENLELTPNEFIIQSGNSNLIHLSCHSSWQYNEYWSSGLLLNGKNDSESLLSVSQVILNGDLRSTGLVNLAACSSGSGSGMLNGIRNYSGIDGAFLNKGARSTISSLWNIGDLTSLFYTVAFYDALKKGLNVELANKTAINSLRNNIFLNNTLSDSVKNMLLKIYPNWKEDLIKSRIDHTNILNWGSYKCSGWTWNGVFLIQSEPQINSKICHNV